MNNGKLLVGITAIFFAIYIFFSPYITVNNMKSAAENHDGEALSEYIDFPSVRQSMKDQINVMVTKRMVEDEEIKGNPFAALGVALVGAMVDRVVDVYVTPAGITQIMAGRKPQPEENSEIAPDRELLAGASMSYDSFDKFVVMINGADGENGKFILRRRGIGWKLTEIIIPLE